MAGARWVAALLLGCTKPQPELLVSRTAALVDDRIEIAAIGLRPSSSPIIRATTLDQRQRPWTRADSWPKIQAFLKAALRDG